MTVSNRQGRRKQGGFSLIEALIAFVILSVGLLGIVSLQAMAKTSQHLAVQHSRAVTLADAIIERIRINPAGLATYNIGTTPLDGTVYSSEPSPDCRSATCTPAQLADHDLWAWEQAMIGAAAKIGTTNTAGLLTPRGCIVFDAAPGMTRTGRLTVILQWQGLHESSDAVQSGDTVCGGGGAGTDNSRRQLVTNTFIVDETEL